MFNPIPDDLFTLNDVDAGEGVDGGEAWISSMPLNPPDPRLYAVVASAGPRRFMFGGTGQDPMTFQDINYTDVWELNADAGWIQVGDSGVNFSHPGVVLSSVVARE